MCHLLISCRSANIFYIILIIVIVVVIIILTSRCKCLSSLLQEISTKVGVLVSARVSLAEDGGINPSFKVHGIH